MTVESFLNRGDKRTKSYKDIKLYVEIIKHHQPDILEKVLSKQVVEIIGINK